MSMYETVKTVNGFDIIRMIGSRGVYHVYIAKNKFVTFKTLKEAVEYIKKEL